MSFLQNLKPKIKTIRYLLEAIVVKLGLWFFWIIGAKKASNSAATIACFIGKKLSVHKLAYRNLSSAMPELSEEEKEKILDGMWDNLGRVVGEYPHITKCSAEEIDGFIEVSEESLQNLEEIKKLSKGGIIFSGHIGNWEAGPKFFSRYGLRTSTVYRPMNNPYVEKMIVATRGIEMISKSSQGNRQIIEAIKSGKFVAILADQKISEGEPVKFFHDDAITTTSIARIVLKYGVPLIPVRSVRIGNNFKFRADIEKPLAIQRTENINFDILQLTCDINRKLESWIREYPAQWFWVHDRWKK